MKIAQVAPIWERVPPKKYGGSERVVYNLTEGLVKRGHQVTLFASGDSQTSAKLVATVPKSLREMGVPWENALYPLYHLAEAFEKADEFDILHTHLNTRQDYPILPFSRFIKTPVVSTTHMEYPTTPDRVDRLQLLKKYKNHPLVSISNAQRKIKGLNYVATVYNGIEINEFEFNEKPKNYLMWLGRFSPSKGAKEAIELAKKTDQKLILAGKIDIYNKEYMEYYKKEIKPNLGQKQIIYLGEVGQKQKANLLKNAYALINLIQWDEPFGLVPVEAMACGTPVIATNRGSMPELIKDGETGFLVKTMDQAISALKRINQISRRACREHVEKNFTVEKMVEGYERVYEKVIKDWKKK